VSYDLYFFYYENSIGGERLQILDVAAESTIIEKYGKNILNECEDLKISAFILLESSITNHTSAMTIV